MDEEQKNIYLDDTDEDILKTESEASRSFDHYRKDLVATIAYLLGFDKEKTIKRYGSEIVEKLSKDKDALTLRYLCMIRMQIFRNYNSIKNERLKLKPLEKIDGYIDGSAVLYLREQGIEVASVSYKGSEDLVINVAYINQYISDKILNLKKFVPDWIKTEYIKKLFLIPDCCADLNGNSLTNKNTRKRIIDRLHEIRQNYKTNISKYPYSLYLNWPKEWRDGDGNVLFNDNKFLKKLYEVNGDTFKGGENLIDARDEDKDNIYRFINGAEKAAIFVDSENVDPYRFAAMLLNLKKDETAKIDRITVYYDTNAPVAWKFLDEFIHIRVEIITIERVIESKSLVDTSISAAVVKAYYNDSVDSVLLASSDSDFVGLIRTEPGIRYFVLNETNKTSHIVTEGLDKNRIGHCFMDEFAMDKVQKFKKFVLKKILESVLDGFNESGCFFSLNVSELIDKVFHEARFVMAEEQLKKEKEVFFEEYITPGFLLKPSKESDEQTLKIYLNLKK